MCPPATTLGDAFPREDDPVLRAELYATCEGGEVVLRLRDGAQHSRIPVADLDPVEALLALEAGAVSTPRTWSRAELDQALARACWARTVPWTLDGQGRPTAAVTSTW